MMSRSAPSGCGCRGGLLAVVDCCWLLVGSIGVAGCQWQLCYSGLAGASPSYALSLGILGFVVEFVGLLCVAILHGCSVGWLGGCVAGWLVGWLEGCSHIRVLLSGLSGCR